MIIKEISIESINNTLIKDLRKLSKSKYRIKENKFIIEGLRFTSEAIRQKADVEYVIIDSGKENVFESIIEEISKNQNEVTLIRSNDEVIKSLSSTETPQGIIAVTTIPSKNYDVSSGKIIYLDRIQDPGNLGTIIRSCHAFDIKTLVLAKGTCDPYQDKVLRSSMGSIFKVNLIHDDEERSVLKSLMNKDFKLYITEVRNSSSLRKTNFSNKSIVVIGNEANGVMEDVLALEHTSVLIEMPGGAESLNAGVAASIIMYEISTK